MLPHEPCWGCIDVELLTPDYKAKHRYRITYVVRNDYAAKYIEDLTEDGRYGDLLGTHPCVQVITDLQDDVATAWGLADTAYGRDQVRNLSEELRQRSVSDRALMTEYFTRAEQLREYTKRNQRTAKRIWEDAHDNR